MWYLMLSSLVEEPHPLTLESVLNRADQVVLEVRLGRASIERSRASFSFARRQLLPNLTLSADSQVQRAMFPGPGGSQSVRQEGSQVDATFTVPIDSNRALHWSIQAAKANARTAEAELEVARLEAQLRAERLFLEVLRADATKAMNESALETARAQLFQAERLLAAKSIAQFEVARLNALVKEREADVLRADAVAQNARIELANLIDLELPEVEHVKASEDAPEEPLNPGQINQALELRAEIKALDSSIDALDSTLRAEAASLQPTVALSAQHQRFLGTAGPFAANEATTLALSVRWNVFDSGRVKARTKELQADLRQLQARRKQAVANIQAQIQSAQVDLEAAVQRREAAQSQVEAAREGFRVTQLRREGGIATLVEVVDAEAQLRTAELAQITAEFDVREARALLRRALGVRTIPKNTPHSNLSEVKK